MTKPLQMLTLVFAFALASTGIAASQDRAPAPPATAKAHVPDTPLKVQVVISRYQGDRKISSLPYTLSVTGVPSPDRGFIGRANLRMGAKIPVTMMAPPAVDGKPVPGVPIGGPIQYQDVGTNIDCNAWATEDGRFRLEITIDDSSVYTDDKDAAGAAKGSPSFR